MNTLAPPPARQIWQDFHWAFFVNTQALVICMRRLQRALEQNDLDGAAIEMDTAANLLAASGAAMELAGNFPQSDYDNLVRPSMEPPNVESEGFSGLMSWEHGVLVTEWRKLRKAMQNIPIELKDSHKRFSESYSKMADGHIHVCQKFVSNNSGSLRYEDRNSIQALKQFKTGRLGMIDPSKRRSAGKVADIN